MAISRVLISVMTYPTLSEKYFETVCTAGFREDGTWIRIFPVPHRLLNDIDKKYHKWQWIEADLEQNPSHDDRPESYHIKNIDTLKTLDRIDVLGKPNWDLRLEWAKRNKKVFKSMNELLELTKRNEISLAVFKPTKIIDLVCEKVDIEQYKKYQAKKEHLEDKMNADNLQLNLFESQEDRDINFKFAEKIPYKFRFKFTSEGDEKPRMLMVEDWETIMVYRNEISRGKSEAEACESVRQKYMGFVQNRDVYFFLGTSYQWQKKNAPDPYLIIGVFYPPKLQGTQMSLF